MNVVPVAWASVPEWIRQAAIAINSLITNTQYVGTVAKLPANAAQGARGFVTDATATTFASVVAGGGANKVPVCFDGTNWIIG